MNGNTFEIIMENKERRVLTEADIEKGSLVYYSEIGPGFGMEAVVAIRPLPENPEAQTG